MAEGLDRPRQLRVAHVIGALVTGGAERFVTALAQELTRQGVNVSVLTLSNRSDRTTADIREILQRGRVSVMAGPTRRVRARSVLWLTSCLRGLCADIVHLHTPNTELAYFFGALAGRPPGQIVRTMHSTSIPANKLFRLAWRFNAAAASIACSSAVKVSAASLPGHVEVIRNGVQFDWPSRDRSRVEEARAALGLDRQLRHFVAAGRMDGDYKGFDVLIHAWKAARLNDLACLHLLGDGAIRAQLESLAANDPRIDFHGMVANVPQWLIAADCFVMPSRHEGLPLAGVEAAGSGIHCIFSDIGPLRELNPPSATWVTAGEADDLRDALQHVAKRPAIFVDPVEVERFRQEFAIEQAASRYLSVYESVCSSRID